MSDQRSTNPTEQEAPESGKGKRPGFFQKLKAVFRKGEMDAPPGRPEASPPGKAKPVSRKGSTSFMKSFKVREVGRGRESAKTAPEAAKEPDWAGEMKEPIERKAPQPEAGQETTHKVRATSQILAPEPGDEEQATPVKASPPPFQQSDKSKPTTPATQLQKPEPRKETTHKVRATSQILAPEPGDEEEETPVQAALTPKPKAETKDPSPGTTVQSTRGKASTGKVRPQSFIIKPDTDELKPPSIGKQTTGRVVPESTVLSPEPGDRPEQVTPPSPPKPPKAQAVSPPPKTETTGPIRPQSVVVGPDTDKVKTGTIKKALEKTMPPGKQTQQIKAQRDWIEDAEPPQPVFAKKEKPATGKVQPQSVVIGPDTERLEPGEKTPAPGKETVSLPAPREAGPPRAKSTISLSGKKDEKAAEEQTRSGAPAVPDSSTGPIKPQSIVLKPDTDQVRPPEGSGKSTRRNLKKETIRKLIPVPRAQTGEKTTGSIPRPKPPQTVPTPPERDTGVIAKGSLTGKIRLEGMERQPPPPPVTATPVTQAPEPLLASSGKRPPTGRVEPKSIIIRPDTEELKKRSGLLTGVSPVKPGPEKTPPEAVKKTPMPVPRPPASPAPQAHQDQRPTTSRILPQTMVLQPEPGDVDDQTPLEPTSGVGTSDRPAPQESGKKKPSTGPIKPQSILLSPDTDELDPPSGDRSQKETGAITAKIRLEGTKPPPPPVIGIPEPRTLEPALKEIPKSKPDTGPVTPQSIVIRPDTDTLRNVPKPERAETSTSAQPAAPLKKTEAPQPSASRPPAPLLQKAKPGVRPKPAAARSGIKAKDAPKAKAAAVPRRRGAPVTPAPAPGPADVARRNKRRRSLAWKGGLIALLLVLLGIGIYQLAIYQDTQLVVQVQEGDRQLEPQVYVVLNIAGKLEIIREEFQRRIRPIENEIDELQVYLSSSRADLAGKTEQMNLLQEAMERYQADIPRYLQESREKLEALWEGRGAELEREYEARKQQYLSGIQERADQLGIPYEPNTEIEAIPVAVNAFRLALYGQKGDIDVAAERGWGESLLKEWADYEEEWRAAQRNIRRTALKLKKEPADKIDSAKRQIDSLSREISAVELDLRMLSDEVDRYETLLADARERRRNAVPPFLDEIGRVPEEFQIASFPLEAGGFLTARNLEETERLQEGDYFVLVQASRGDEQWWAVKPVQIVPNEINSILIEAGDFRSFSQILESDDDILVTLIGPSANQL